MPVIASISGIRGTIGGTAKDNLTPRDIVRYTAAYAALRRQSCALARPTIVVGRDARPSGEMIANLVVGTLRAMGCDVLDIGLATTPTTELAVIMSGAAGGIIITASHNPQQWNALKLLNDKGEFLSADDGKRLLAVAGEEAFVYAASDTLGTYATADYGARHIDAVLRLPLVDAAAIRAAHFRVAVDVINSVGALVLPPLLESLGVDYTLINGAPTGIFAHNPEPVAQHLQGIMTLVAQGGYDLGIVVDPDVDRLAFINEDGTMFGEEYTLVSVADYVLSKTAGNTVSNLSSTRALRDITAAHGGTYYAAAVGEVNVTAKMKAVGAVIGGEGNGGVIYPACHYGRDALVGIALFLTALAERKTPVSAWRAALPAYHIAKEKVVLPPTAALPALLAQVEDAYRGEQITTIDGVKVDFADRWVHIRQSNTEPIVRIYSEAPTLAQAEALAHEVKDIINLCARREESLLSRADAKGL